MRREEWQFLGAEGENLFVRDWQPSNRDTRAVVCLAHGIGEHGDRYGHVAALMTEAGFALTALDHYGHGRSSGKRGHMFSLDAAVANLELVTEEARKKNPGLPVFIYGHSMGGNVALNYALRRRPSIQGLVLTSPWLRLVFPPSPVVEWIGKRAISIFPTFQLPTRIHPKDLFRPGYLEAAPIQGDPLCHTKITLNAYFEVIAGSEWAFQNANRLNVPLLLLHGMEDRITSMEASEQFADAAGDLCEFRRWPGGLHELHNDVEGKLAIETIIVWISQLLS